MKVGIFGLPGSGKTTLWCFLTETLEGPDPALAGKVQLRTVKVRDPRLEKLRDDYEPKKFTPATLAIGDFPALPSTSGDKTSADDRASLAKMLAPARIMDVILVVLRSFQSNLSPPPGGVVDPFRDWTEIQSEFLLSDLAIIEKRVEKLRVQAKKPTPTQDRDRKELALLERLLPHLEAERALRDFDLHSDEQKMLTGYQFLSAKPMVAVLNRGDAAPDPEQLSTLEARIETAVFPLAAGNELEILQLAEEDQATFREEFGLKAGARDAVISACYEAAGLTSFFTVGDKEVRAWTIRKGEAAVEAAEEIHSDIARGFIRAETVSFDDYVSCGGIKGAREKGQFRLEGKDYVVQDGDIIEFRFSV